MATPNKGKKATQEFSDNSPKNFRWAQPYEDTLLELLVSESRKGNRPDATFTSTQFRNIVADFNRIHGTFIQKKHVQSMIKTMKSHFHAFHGAFNGLSGFSWNDETKMFEAEDELWAQRIQENPTLAKFQEKACHNYDKLYELYGDTRATGAEAIAIKETARRLNRAIDFAEVGRDADNFQFAARTTVESSSYGEFECSNYDAPPNNTPEHGSTHQTDGSTKSKNKRKSTLISVMEDRYKTMAASIDKLSMALVGTREKVAASRFDLALNGMIFEALSALGLEEKYKVRCYLYLTAYPLKAAQLLAAPDAIRGSLLSEIMSSCGEDK